MPVVFYLNYSKILIEIIADDSAIFLSKRYSFDWDVLWRYDDSSEEWRILSYYF